jgi:hypothetical protein
MENSTMQRVTDPDDPRRCRATATSGSQCMGLACEDSDRCPSHGGAKSEAQERNEYLTEQFNARMKIDGQAHDEVKLLRENLMTLNAMIAARTGMITGQSSLIANSAPLADLVMKSEKVTVSLQRLATQSGLLLAKPALITWGQEIVAAVADMVEDKYDGWEDDLHALSDKIATIIINTSNPDDEK